MSAITILDGGMGQELVRRAGDAPTRARAGGGRIWWGSTLRRARRAPARLSRGTAPPCARAADRGGAAGGVEAGMRCSSGPPARQPQAELTAGRVWAAGH